MNKGIKNSVVVAMMGLCIGLSACGEKQADNLSGIGEKVSQDNQSVQQTTKNDILSEEYTPVANCSLKFPREFLTEKFTMQTISHNDRMDRQKATQYICASSYMGDYEDKLVTSLEDCVGSCDKNIKNSLSNVHSHKYHYEDINITSQKKVTVNGKEMLKVYGSVPRFDALTGDKLEGTTSIVGYYTIIDFKMNGTPEGKQQVYWYGFYENESDKAIMEEYVDAMAESFKQN